MKQHLLINSILLISFFFLPWWFSALISIASLFFVKNFWEIIIWGFIFDIFYGIHGGIHNTFFFGTILAIIFYLITFPIRKRLLVQ